MLRTTSFFLISTLIFFYSHVLNAEETEANHMEDFLTAMPKVELHLHLEGTLEAETIVDIVHRNQLDYFRTVEEVQQSLASRPPGLMGFLQHHYKMQNVMQTRQDFYQAMYGLIKRLSENNVIYADIFFDPQAHTSRGISFEDMFAGIHQARLEAGEKFGVTVNLIMCIQRERSVESAVQMLEQAQAFKQHILGLGMDSGPEYGNPPLKFKEVYERARNQGYYLTGHHDVDVQDSVKHIWQSIDQLKLDRIDHGLNAIDDAALVQQLVDRALCLTGSPVKRKTDKRMQDVDRIMALDSAGVCVSINTDDPEEFESGYLSNMLIVFQQTSGYGKADMTRLMWNAFRAVWVPENEKNQLIKQLKTYARENGVDWQSAIGESKDS